MSSLNESTKIMNNDEINPKQRNRSRGRLQKRHIIKIARIRLRRMR